MADPLTDCMKAKAPGLDDGVSDAATIGRVVASSCAPEGEAAKQAFIQANDVRGRRGLSEVEVQFRNMEWDLGTQAVLLARRHGR